MHDRARLAPPPSALLLAGSLVRYLAEPTASGRLIWVADSARVAPTWLRAAHGSRREGLVAAHCVGGGRLIARPHALARRPAGRRPAHLAAISGRA